MDSIALLESRRLRATSGLDRRHRSALGQFFTPAQVARYMAALLRFRRNDAVRLLDAGAGIGLLTAAVAARRGSRPIHATCYELEPRFQSELQATLHTLPNVSAVIEPQDFIAHAVQLLTTAPRPDYTHVILNPPYKKIGRRSSYRSHLRTLGLETGNLYAGFLACAVALCRRGAQIVAIVPRSFMNGLYFKPFRCWFLDRVAITHIHVFERRDQAFSDDRVLQENVILRAVVGGRQRAVTITAARDASFAGLQRCVRPFAQVVIPGEPERFLHIPTPGAAEPRNLPGHPLRELGLEVSTGPVVDFRLREQLRMQPEPGAVPLLYAAHFQTGVLQWPGTGRKPSAIVRNAATERWLWPRGSYVVLRRLSSKEEKRRIVACLVDEAALPEAKVGFENHLNVFHQGRKGLPRELARGLMAYLNSQAVDDYFRSFSGQTQVNATDLRHLRYPSRAELCALAKERP